MGRSRTLQEILPAADHGCNLHASWDDCGACSSNADRLQLLENSMWAPIVSLLQDLDRLLLLVCILLSGVQPFEIAGQLSTYGRRLHDESISVIAGDHDRFTTVPQDPKAFECF